MNHLSKKHEQGFSLVETLVAIAILLIVITGPMAISTQTARSTSFSSEQVVAFFLAQEGAEIAQKARDEFLLENFLGGGGSYRDEPWTDFINTSGTYGLCYASAGCRLEVDTDATGSVKTPVACSGTSCKLYVASTTNQRARYTHDDVGNEPSLYTRVVKFDRVPNNATAQQVKVTSEVTWRTGSLRDIQRVKVETYLFNVYDQN